MDGAEEGSDSEVAATVRSIASLRLQQEDIPVDMLTSYTLPTILFPALSAGNVSVGCVTCVRDSVHEMTRTAAALDFAYVIQGLKTNPCRNQPVPMGRHCLAPSSVDLPR